MVNSFLISENQTQTKNFKFLLLAYELLDTSTLAEDYDRDIFGDLIAINKIIIQKIIDNIPNLREYIVENQIYYDSLKDKIEGQRESNEEYLDSILQGEYIIPNNSALPLELYKFASAVILGYKHRIKKIETSFDSEVKNVINGLPLDYLYQKIFDGKWEARMAYTVE